MYAFGVEYVNRARQRRGRRRDENRKSSVVKLFNDEGRHKGILDLSQRRLPLALLTLSPELPGHTANYFVPWDLLEERPLHPSAHRLPQFGAEEQANEDAKNHHEQKGDHGFSRE